MRDLLMFAGGAVALFVVLFLLSKSEFYRRRKIVDGMKKPSPNSREPVSENIVVVKGR